MIVRMVCPAETMFQMECGGRMKEITKAKSQQAGAFEGRTAGGLEVK